MSGRDRPDDDLSRRDPMGRMALFSTPEPEAGAGRERSLFVECSSCLNQTDVRPVDLVRSAFPFSVHLPLIRRYHSLMRSPACGSRTWVRVGYRS